MANQSVQNIKGLLSNKATRVVMVLTFGALVAGFIVANMATNNQEKRAKDLQAAISTAAPPAVTATPGTSDNPEYNAMVRAGNRRDLEASARTGESAVPRISNTADGKERDPFDLTQKKPADPKSAEPAPVAVAPVVPVQQVQAPVAPRQPIQKTAAQLQSERDMSNVMSALLNSWAPSPQRIEYDMTGKAQAGQQSAPVQVAQSPMGNVGQGGVPAQQVPPMMKAGTVLNAVVITSVNSDEPGPILAQIVSGPYTGARVVGRFEMSKSAESVVMSFKTMNVPSLQRSVQLDAVAVDPDSARTALASDVDHHYLSRYGMLLASSFVKGYADAVKNQGTTQTVTAGAGGIATTTSYPSLDDRKIAIAALGEVGGVVAEGLKQDVKRPPTVTVTSGTPIGLLVMQDVSGQQ